MGIPLLQSIGAEETPRTIRLENFTYPQPRALIARKSEPLNGLRIWCRRLWFCRRRNHEASQGGPYGLLSQTAPRESFATISSIVPACILMPFARKRRLSATIVNARECPDRAPGHDGTGKTRRRRKSHPTQSYASAKHDGSRHLLDCSAAVRV